MTESVRSLTRAWAGLRPLTEDEVAGDLEASFVPPLHRIAPRGLALVGLPRWFGKRLRADGTGVNLIRPRGRGSGLIETLPMQVGAGPSMIDGQPALIVTYPPNGPRPWRWVRDELRERADGVVVGMTVLDLPGLRRLGGTPFLLHRVLGDHLGGLGGGLDQVDG